jgi:homoserine dehydrogenase
MKKIKIALLGLGTVGGGTLELLKSNKKLLEEKIGAQITICWVLVRNLKKKRSSKLKGIKLTSDLKQILADHSIDVFFDATGDSKLGITVMKFAAKNGKKVITANKALLAEQWGKLNEQVCFSENVAFEAAVGGTIPIIDVLKNGLAANEISAVYGIVNGTCNYILTQMQQQEIDFKTALKKAMDLGFSELDPSLDIGGFDAAHKLIIMMNLIYSGCFSFSSLPIEGIEKLNSDCFFFAKKMGYCIKLLATTQKKKKTIAAYVHPTLVPVAHPLAKISGVENAIFIQGDFCGSVMLTGAGAGDKPTASAMVSDFVQMLTTKKENKKEPFLPKEFLPITELAFEYFILFEVEDKIGVLKTISQIFYKNAISVKSMLQADAQKKNLVKMILLTHSAKEKNLLCAIENLKKEVFVASKIQFLRIFNEQK